MKKLFFIFCCSYLAFCCNSEKRRISTWNRRSKILIEECLIKDSLINLNLFPSSCACKNVEIGKEEFHAELVVNESKKQMVIYLLDKDAKSFIAIEAPFLAANFMLAGKPVQVQLKSIPQDFDQNGMSSCFGAVSPELIDALHAAKSDPKLAVRIRNKSYVTKIIHKHDHSGHNHAQQPLVVPSKRR